MFPVRQRRSDQQLKAVPYPSQLDWGEHPMDFRKARFHVIAVIMSAHKLMKAVFGNANRSGFHYFLTSALPVRRAPEAGFDVLGVVMVVSLSAGVVLLMRLILIN